LLFFCPARGRFHILDLGGGAVPLYNELFMSVTAIDASCLFMDPGGCRGQGINSPNRFWRSAPVGFWGKDWGLPTQATLFAGSSYGLHLSRHRRELGFVARSGGCCFVVLGIRGWQVAKRAPDLFGQLLAAGITCWVLLQATINMGVSCGLLPTKGLPLPFVSFGGSSLIITMAAVGIL